MKIEMEIETEMQKKRQEEREQKEENGRKKQADEDGALVRYDSPECLRVEKKKIERLEWKCRSE